MAVELTSLTNRLKHDLAVALDELRFEEEQSNKKDAQISFLQSSLDRQLATRETLLQALESAATYSAHLPVPQEALSAREFVADALSQAVQTLDTEAPVSLRSLSKLFSENSPTILPSPNMSQNGGEAASSSSSSASATWHLTSPLKSSKLPAPSPSPSPAPAPIPSSSSLSSSSSSSSSSPIVRIGQLENELAQLKRQMDEKEATNEVLRTKFFDAVNQMRHMQETSDIVEQTNRNLTAAVESLQKELEARQEDVKLLLSPNSKSKLKSSAKSVVSPSAVDREHQVQVLLRQREEMRQQMEEQESSNKKQIEDIQHAMEEVHKASLEAASKRHSQEMESVSNKCSLLEERLRKTLLECTELQALSESLTQDKIELEQQAVEMKQKVLEIQAAATADTEQLDARLRDLEKASSAYSGALSNANADKEKLEAHLRNLEMELETSQRECRDVKNRAELLMKECDEWRMKCEAAAVEWDKWKIKKDQEMEEMQREAMRMKEEAAEGVMHIMNEERKREQDTFVKQLKELKQQWEECGQRLRDSIVNCDEMKKKAEEYKELSERAKEETQSVRSELESLRTATKSTVEASMAELRRQIEAFTQQEEKHKLRASELEVELNAVKRNASELGREFVNLADERDALLHQCEALTREANGVKELAENSRRKWQTEGESLLKKLEQEAKSYAESLENEKKSNARQREEMQEMFSKREAALNGELQRMEKENDHLRHSKEHVEQQLHQSQESLHALATAGAELRSKLETAQRYMQESEKQSKEKISSLQRDLERARDDCRAAIELNSQLQKEHSKSIEAVQMEAKKPLEAIQQKQASAARAIHELRNLLSSIISSSSSSQPISLPSSSSSSASIGDYTKELAQLVDVFRIALADMSDERTAMADLAQHLADQHKELEHEREQFIASTAITAAAAASAPSAKQQSSSSSSSSAAFSTKEQQNTELTQLRKDFKTTQAALKTHVDELARVRATLTELNHEKQSLSNSLQQKDARLRQLSGELDRWKKQALDLEASAASSGGSLSAASLVPSSAPSSRSTSPVNGSKSSVSSSKLDSLQKENSELKVQMDKLIRHVQDMESLSAASTERESSLNAQIKQVTAARHALQEQLERFNGFDQDLSAMQDEMMQVQSLVQMVLSVVETSDGLSVPPEPQQAASSSSSKIPVAKKPSVPGGSSSSSKDSGNSMYTRHAELVKALVGRLTEVAQGVTAHGRVLDLRAQLRIVLEENRKLSARISEQEQELQVARNHLSTLAKAFADCESKVLQLTHERNKAELDITKRDEVISAMQNAIMTAKSELKRLHDKIHDKDSEILRLKHALDSTLDERNKAEMMLDSSSSSSSAAHDQ